MARGEMRLITKTFMDKEAVLQAWEKGKIKGLTSAGALVRFISRQSLKKPTRVGKADRTPEEQVAWEKKLRKARRTGKPRPRAPYKSSPTGSPPFNKQGTLKKFIFFGRDPSTDSMYVGPVPIGGARTAHLLEHGGTAVLKGSDGKRHQMTFKGNPFMGPALDEAKPQIPAMFKDVVKADAVSFGRGNRAA